MRRAATGLLLGILAAAAALAAPRAGDELVLEIPELAVQSLLDRASPLEGKTPEGLKYSIANPRVRIRGGRILTTMDISIYGGINLLGRELGISLQGSLEGEIVVRIDGGSRTIEGGLEISRLEIKDLEDLSDADELKTFLSRNVTHFSYPIDVPPADVPELGILLGGSITGIEVQEGRVVLRARIRGSRAG